MNKQKDMENKMETITIEKRELIYLLNLANKEMVDVIKRFKEIDNKMSKIDVGSTVYELTDWDPIGKSYYTQTISKIINRENGVVEIYEPNLDRHSIANIYDLYLEME